MSECLQTFVTFISTKSVRVLIMFILTIISATIEIIFGLRAHSQSLIADGLYSFAEGLCLIGVIIVLRYSHSEKHRQKRNTFGYERLELLFGLLQEVFLLSISLGIIVDAINHLANPSHVHEPEMMIYLGFVGILVGIIGMIMFWGYHHDHDIEEEITEKKKDEFLSWTLNMFRTRHKKARKQAQKTSAEAVQLKESDAPGSPSSPEPSYTFTIPDQEVLQEFTYGKVEIKEHRIYATLHALCLHSFVVLLEACIVLGSGLLIKYIPHNDPVTGKEINHWLKYIDPLLTLIMVVIIAIRAVPVIFSISGMLIENVPPGIDTQVVMKEILTALPAIKTIHSCHIWRATAKEIYATMHLICNENIPLAVCTQEYGAEIEKILRGYCIQYFTLQFEYVNTPETDACYYGLRRKCRGHRSNQDAEDSKRKTIHDHDKQIRKLIETV